MGEMKPGSGGRVCSQAVSTPMPATIQIFFAGIPPLAGIAPAGQPGPGNGEPFRAHGGHHHGTSGLSMPDLAQGDFSIDQTDTVTTHDPQTPRNPPHHQVPDPAAQQTPAAQDHDLSSASRAAQVAAAQALHPAPASEVSVRARSAWRSVQACVALFWLALPACAELRAAMTCIPIMPPPHPRSPSPR